MRRVPFTNMMNMRDLGGYPVGQDSYIAYRKFIRSDAPIDLSDDEIKHLLDNKINTVIDLRNDEEVLKRPCALKDKVGFQYFHCKLYGDGRLPLTSEDVPISYFEMVDEKTSMLAVMKVIAHAKEGVLYHCSAGKDRTGIVSAILLSLAGVSESDILADYQISYAYIAKMLRQLALINPDFPKNVVEPKIEYMEKFLEMFYEKYGSSKGYLLEIGLNEDEIEKIIQKMLFN
jgi:protein-tyrosine phosphatase